MHFNFVTIVTALAVALQGLAAPVPMPNAEIQSLAARADPPKDKHPVAKAADIISKVPVRSNVGSLLQKVVQAARVPPPRAPVVARPRPAPAPAAPAAKLPKIPPMPKLHPVVQQAQANARMRQAVQDFKNRNSKPKRSLDLEERDFELEERDFEFEDLVARADPPKNGGKHPVAQAADIISRVPVRSNVGSLFQKIAQAARVPAPRAPAVARPRPAPAPAAPAAKLPKIPPMPKLHPVIQQAQANARMRQAAQAFKNRNSKPKRSLELEERDFDLEERDFDLEERDFEFEDLVARADPPKKHPIAQAADVISKVPVRSNVGSLFQKIAQAARVPAPRAPAVARPRPAPAPAAPAAKLPKIPPMPKLHPVVQQAQANARMRQAAQAFKNRNSKSKRSLDLEERDLFEIDELD